MSKRSYRIIVLLIFLTTTVSQAMTDKYRAMWREDPSTTMVIGWNQISGHLPVIFYDLMDYGEDNLQYSYSQVPDKVVVSKGLNNHYVRLRNLYPSTTYYFIIKDSEGCSKRMSFRTAPDNPYERLSIIAGGDSRNYREARRNANKLVAKLRPHCVMFGGDMTGGDRADQWKNWFDDWQYTIPPDGRLTPIIVTRGNHEYSNQTLTDLFDVASPNAYYALSLGGNLVRLYTLNSLIASGGNQKKWLENDLQQHQGHIWKLAQYHFAIRPHTAKKSERNSQLINWGSLFYKYHVNLAVESDAHVVKWTYPIRPSRERGSEEGFIRDDRSGTVYVGEGCWGAPIRRNNDDKVWTRNSGSFNQFKLIFIDMDQIEVRTVKTDNADDVGYNQAQDIFSFPKSLDLWHPSNGPVVIIDRNKGGINNNAVFAQNNMEITDFSACLEDTGVAIKWSTENEPSANILFEVQRAYDNSDYQTIASVHGAGSGENSYTIYDKNYKAVPISISYRIKQFPGSGQANISKPKEVIPVAYEWQNYKTLKPDPSNGMIRAKYVVNNAADISIRLVDLRDKILTRDDYENQRTGKYLRSIDMKRFPAGHYLLTIRADDNILEQFLVVK